MQSWACQNCFEMWGSLVNECGACGTKRVCTVLVSDCELCVLALKSGFVGLQPYAMPLNVVGCRWVLLEIAALV